MEIAAARAGRGRLRALRGGQLRPAGLRVPSQHRVLDGRALPGARPFGGHDDAERGAPHAREGRAGDRRPGRAQMAAEDLMLGMRMTVGVTDERVEAGRRRCCPSPRRRWTELAGEGLAEHRERALAPHRARLALRQRALRGAVRPGAVGARFDLHPPMPRPLSCRSCALRAPTGGPAGSPTSPRARRVDRASPCGQGPTKGSHRSFFTFPTLVSTRGFRLLI